MAPEILRKDINLKTFSSFLKADVYSFSLVIWETLQRVQGDWRQAFDDSLFANPCIEDAKEVVADKMIRPHATDNMKKNFSKYQSIMEEMWADKPMERISMLRVLKNLEKI